MKIILLEDVKALGHKGDVCEVSTGYARNFILPQKKGIEATPANLNSLKLKIANDAKVAQENLELAKDMAERLEKSPIVIKVKQGGAGKLYGAIANKDIADAVYAQHKIEIDKKKIVLDEPIKAVGNYEIKIKLHKDVAAMIKLTVEEM